MKHLGNETNLSDFRKMKNIAKAYITKCECSVQEAVYLLMLELGLRKTFPKVTFLNSNMPGSCYCIFCTEEEISELLEQSTNIFQRNMLDRYID